MVKKTLSFKKLITNVLIDNKQNVFVSRIMIFKKISDIKKKFNSEKRLKSFIKRALDDMEINKVVIRKKHSYRLCKQEFEELMKRTKGKNNKNKRIKNSKAKKLKIPKMKKASLKTVSTKVTSLINKKRYIKNTANKLKSKSNPRISTKNQTNFALPLSNSLPSYAPINIHPSFSMKASYHKRYQAIWQYFDDNNFNAVVKRSDGWYDYDWEASDVVEDEWQRYIVNRAMNDVRSVKSGQWEYMVDFVNWKQTNIIHQNHKVRSIRRLDENGNVTINPYIN